MALVHPQSFILTKYQECCNSMVKGDEANIYDILQQICVREKFKALAKNYVLARTMHKRVRKKVVKMISNAKPNYFKENTRKC